MAALVSVANRFALFQSAVACLLASFAMSLSSSGPSPSGFGFLPFPPAFALAFAFATAVFVEATSSRFLAFEAAPLVGAPPLTPSGLSPLPFVMFSPPASIAVVVFASEVTSQVW